ncbi:MAG: succinate dehydrogenase, cytochrome b556 subunit [gamma proteobacterium symbiont of Lucinoma myriamae]|nr:succinate dehydrogenase, cytochrome b556 subunit [gamma proteobacterium symbiont of Lucinoma myriamae]MCU7817829.1 succinate dehydrogenase, cytochrome b556 subunit [gamma proteobacterium symbiont of Lucinoma myriamae]MCU7832936.1 succinate dehydrogenase, cytochrome b556 subunit [gamma proteobacterium symbiont of Lucinoma myriamae]
MYSLDKRMNKRPKNLNLLSVKFPMSAIMSAGHRAAGILLFLSIPYFIYIFQLSIINETGFIQAKAELQSPLVKVFCLITIWALVHHFLAGIRYFLLDVDIGIEKKWAQKTAFLVMVSGFVIFLVILFFYI